MNQATFSFVPQQADACDSTGFELGWDHAHHGLVPPAELLLEGTPVSHGWRAGKAVFGRRTLVSTRAVRQWLALRTHAWRRGLAYEATQLTAHYLAQIETASCPVTRQPFGGSGGSGGSGGPGGSGGSPDAPVVQRLNGAAGYAAGNLVLVSQRAAQAHDIFCRHGASAALQQAARIDAGIDVPVEGLAAAECWRLAVLTSFVTPLPFCEAARVPLRVLPPNRVRLLNAVQGLQALVTMQFSAPGWSARVRALAELLPRSTHGQALRHDFNLFIGALAPRLLEAGAGRDARATRRALEDAWADARLNRRWQQFVMALGEAGTETLLQRAAETGLAGLRTLLHAPEQATDGWALASSGCLPEAPRRAAAATPDHRKVTGHPHSPAPRA